MNKRLVLNESSGKIKNAKKVFQIYSEEQIKIIEETNDKILEGQRERAKTLIKAKNFIAR